MTADCVAVIDRLQSDISTRFGARALRVAEDRWVPDGGFAAVVVTQTARPPAALIVDDQPATVECMLWAWALTRFEAYERAGTLRSDQGEGIVLASVDRRAHADRLGITDWGWQIGRMLAAVDAPPAAFDHIYCLLPAGTATSA